MKQRRHTPEQVIRKLAEGDKLLAEGKTIEEVARHLEVFEPTWHRWRNHYDGTRANDNASGPMSASSRHFGHRCPMTPRSPW
jgi:transposase-like protein